MTSEAPKRRSTDRNPRKLVDHPALLYVLSVMAILTSALALFRAQDGVKEQVVEQRDAILQDYSLRRNIVDCQRGNESRRAARLTAGDLLALTRAAEILANPRNLSPTAIANERVVESRIAAFRIIQRIQERERGIIKRPGLQDRNCRVEERALLDSFLRRQDG